MRINDITIKNFRGFIEERHFELDAKMNVVLGNNTMGKTTLLQAIQIALGAYLKSLSQLPSEDAFKKNFKVDDRPLVYSEAIEDFLYPTKENPTISVHATMSTIGKVEGQPFEEMKDIEWSREMKGKTTVNTGGLAELVKKWEGYRILENSETDVVLPLVLAFGADRIDNNYKLVDKKANISRLVKAYKCALAETVDFKSALAWYYNFNSKGKKSPEVEGTDIAFEEALATAARIKNIAREEGNRSFWADVKVVGANESTRLKYEMMSSGFKAMVNMVAEIAYRCIMLNRWMGRDAVRKTPGIVLIDEIDLYLHPHWQQHVLADLQEAFPEIQFVVSTHSPFIVQSVDSQNVIALDSQNAPISPNNRGIEEILACEMGMQGMLRSKTYRTKQELAKKYFELVKAGKSGEAETEEVKKKLNELELEAGLLHDPAYEAFLKLNRGKL